MRDNQTEGQFGQLVVMLGFASPVAVSECIQVQKSLEKKGEKKPLGQILVEHRILSLEQVRHVLLRQGKTLLVCRQCKSKFNLADPYSGDLFKCRICKGSVDVVETPEELEEEKADPFIGMTIAGCRISERIGEDGVTRSYKAWQVAHQRDVVMRILKQKFGKDKELIKQFLKQAAAASKVRHPSVVPIYDVGQAEGYFYICHGYVEGRTLREKIEDEGRFPVRRAVMNFIHIVNGIEQAHKMGVIHRDLRPGNIIYPEGKQRPVIAGLGFVKRAGERAEGGELGIMHGCPDFMAPEQIKNYSASDKRSDVFSLCALLFYMIVGKSPFSGDDPIEVLASNLEGRKPKLSDVTKGLPKEICGIVDRGLSRHPDQRFRDAEELKAAFESIKPQSLSLEKAELTPQPTSLEGVSEELLLEEEKEYSIDERKIELAPLPEEKEIRLADEEKRKDEKAPLLEEKPSATTLSEEEKAKIVEETLAEPDTVKEEAVEEKTAPPETPLAQLVSRTKELVEEKPLAFLLGGIGALILIVILVLLLSGESEKPTTPVKTEGRIAYENLRAIIETSGKEPQEYEEIISRCKEYLEKYGRERYAKEVRVWLSEYEEKSKQKRIEEEWSELQSFITGLEEVPDEIVEAIKKLEEFARKYPSHPLSREANSQATGLREKVITIRAERFLSALEERVKELCKKAEYGRAKAEVERGLPPELPSKRYKERLEELRGRILTLADSHFGRIKTKAESLARKNRIEEALMELSQVKEWGLENLITAAEKESTAIRADFLRRLWVRRMVAEATLQQSFIETSKGNYEAAKKTIEETLKDSLLAENYGQPLKDMLVYIDMSEQFSNAHIDYLKKQVGKGIELRTVKGILVKGTLKKITGNELHIGDYPPVYLSEIPYEKRCEYARLALGGDTPDAVLAEACFRYFRGEVTEAYKMLKGRTEEPLKRLAEKIVFSRFFEKVERNRLLFSGVDVKRWKTTQKLRLKVKELKGETVGVLLCEKSGSFFFKQPLLRNYILRLEFRFTEKPSSLTVILPYDEKNSVHLRLPEEEGTLKIKEAKESESIPIHLYPEIWYELEVRFIDGRYTVLLDGKSVLKVSSKPFFSEVGKESRLGFSLPGDGWMFKNILLLEAP